MKAKNLLVLTAMLAVALVVAIMLSKKNDGEPPEGTAQPGDRPFASVPINDITGIAITDSESSVELERSGEKWVVRNRGGYAANFTKLGNALRKLKEMQIADTVRAGESSYGRLDVKTPDPEVEDADGSGKLVVLKGDGDTEFGSFIVGKRFEGATGATGYSSGSYLRDLGDADYVYIVSESLFDLAAKPADWLERDFFKIEKPDDVTVTHADGTVFEFTREKEGDTATMAGLAEDEEPNTANTTTLSAPFASASFKDVVTGENASPEKTGLDKPVKAKVTTFDGFTYDIELGEGAGENTDSAARNATVTSATYYITYDVSAQLPEAREPEEDEKVADDASEEEKTKAEGLKKTRDDAFEKAQEVLKEKLEKEKALAGNIYQIDSWAAEKFFKGRDELVKKKEEEEPAAGAAAAPSLPMPTVGEGLGALRPPEDNQAPVVATTPAVSVADVLEEAKAKAAEAGDTAEEVKEKIEDIAED